MKLPHESLQSAVENFTLEDTVASKDPSEHARRSRLHGIRKGSLKAPRRGGLTGKQNENRFNKTIAVLRSSGLLEITTQTSKLLEESFKLQKEIDQLKQATLAYTRTLIQEESYKPDCIKRPQEQIT
ncbi:hypothetical protein OS493_000970 [Desmophyllum pertusum]|uniref:Uncharacterized protein n=1 Tax=Desmophyllum pertusum TaxID=174260 RepID=A0A9W9ZUC7_9CNID|nr:hypothetical protein OS493_000970 [Desmophyllum pertusum]